MHYRQYLPSDALRNYVECYWVASLHRDDFGRQRLIPGGRVELIFNFGSPVSWMYDELGQSSHTLKNEFVVMGQRNKIYYASFEGAFNMAGIRFKPAGITAFTNIPVANLLNNLLDAEDVFGAGMKPWCDKICNAQTDEEKIHVFDKLLLSILRNEPAEWNAMQGIINSIRANNLENISAACYQTGWNYKKLERSFLKYAGYSPKQYMRIVRFNKALRKIDTNQESLTSIGFDCGYYDQAHFIKDCIHLAGTTPGKLQTGDQIITSFLIKHQAV